MARRKGRCTSLDVLSMGDKQPFFVPGIDTRIAGHKGDGFRSCKPSTRNVRTCAVASLLGKCVDAGYGRAYENK